ncbi:MAG: CGNR zinc finger domain-containing protein [Anaerolineales bacterium]
MDFESPYCFSAGFACLDFCNTFDHRHTAPEYDFLADRETLVRWGRRAGILSSKHLYKPIPDARSFKKSVQTRNLIFDLFAPFTRSSAPKPAVVNAFFSRLQAIMPEMALVASPDGYRPVCKSKDPLEQIECAILQSALELLLSNQTDRIRECDGCGWLFFDGTRNRSRRWCTMAVCGNRAKAKRHYTRTRNAGGTTRP